MGDPIPDPGPAADLLRLPEALARSGLNYRRLDYAVRRGWLVPVQEEAGSGMPRLWPATEVEVAVRYRRLVDEVHMEPAAAAVLARDVARAGAVLAAVEGMVTG
jgi:hypothetical protein